MGGDRKTDKWDFTKAKRLLKIGYPADRIFNNRGGKQLWKLWGMTTVIPGA